MIDHIESVLITQTYILPSTCPLRLIILLLLLLLSLPNLCLPHSLLRSRDGSPYCEEHYKIVSSNPCYVCSKPLSDKFIEAEVHPSQRPPIPSTS